jgi:hypothetical protein
VTLGASAAAGRLDARAERRFETSWGIEVQVSVAKKTRRSARASRRQRPEDSTLGVSVALKRLYEHETFQT